MACVLGVSIGRRDINSFSFQVDAENVNHATWAHNSHFVLENLDEATKFAYICAISLHSQAAGYCNRRYHATTFSLAEQVEASCLRLTETWPIGGGDSVPVKTS